MGRADSAHFEADAHRSPSERERRNYDVEVHNDSPNFDNHTTQEDFKMTLLSQSCDASARISLAIVLAMTCASALGAGPQDVNEEKRQTLTEIPEPFVGTWVNETERAFFLLIKPDSLMWKSSQQEDSQQYAPEDILTDPAHTTLTFVRKREGSNLNTGETVTLSVPIKLTRDEDKMIVHYGKEAMRIPGSFMLLRPRKVVLERKEEP
jgi:hypothetical protein